MTRRYSRPAPSKLVSDEELTRQALRLLWKDGFIRPGRDGRWNLTSKGLESLPKTSANRRKVN